MGQQKSMNHPAKIYLPLVRRSRELTVTESIHHNSHPENLASAFQLVQPPQERPDPFFDHWLQPSHTRNREEWIHRRPPRTMFIVVNRCECGSIHAKYPRKPIPFVSLFA